MNKYEDMTIEQLEEINNKMGAKRLEIKGEQSKVVAVLDAKKTEKKAAEKLAAMTDNEKKALARVIEAEGIESAEAVGEPGGLAVGE